MRKERRAAWTGTHQAKWPVNSAPTIRIRIIAAMANARATNQIQIKGRPTIVATEIVQVMSRIPIKAIKTIHGARAKSPRPTRV